METSLFSHVPSLPLALFLCSIDFIGGIPPWAERAHVALIMVDQRDPHSAGKTGKYRKTVETKVTHIGSRHKAERGVLSAITWQIWNPAENVVRHLSGGHIDLPVKAAMSTRCSLEDSADGIYRRYDRHSCCFSPPILENFCETVSKIRILLFLIKNAFVAPKKPGSSKYHNLLLISSNDVDTKRS